MEPKDLGAAVADSKTEQGATSEKEQQTRVNFRDYVLEQSKNGNVVFAALDGYAKAPLNEFIKQPADGILCDLNRLPEVVLTFIDDPKWVNDFAVYQVIKRLRELMPEWQPIETAPRDSSWILAVVRTGRQVVIRWGGGAWEDDNRLCRDPVQWMPLPDPPCLSISDRGADGQAS